MPKKRKTSVGAKGKGTRGRSVISGRFVKVKARPDAEEFSRQFNRKYRSTLRELSKR